MMPKKGELQPIECPKCGLPRVFRTDSKRTIKVCLPCRALRDRLRYPFKSEEAKNRKRELSKSENAKKKRRERQRKYILANPEKFRLKRKNRRQRQLLKDPSFERVRYSRELIKRISGLGRSVILYENSNKHVWNTNLYKSKNKLNDALRKTETAFTKLKEIAMTKPMTFQVQAKTMTTEELFNEFNACSVRVSEGLYRMAVIWMELENRGENLSVIKTPFRQFFPDIASGRLLPEVALEYGGSPKKVEIFAKLLPEDQRKLVGDNATVPLVVRNDNGEPIVEHVNPLGMRLSEARQVFGDGRIRSPEEQKPYLPAAPATPKPEVKQSAELNPQEFHLWYALSGQQRDELAKLASIRKMTVAEFVKDLLERTKAITKASASKAEKKVA